MAEKRAETKRRQRVQRELPPVGTQLAGRYKGETFTATVVASEGSQAGRAVECRGERYASLSAAAKAVAGHSVNGWRFWKEVEAASGE